MSGRGELSAVILAAGLALAAFLLALGHMSHSVWHDEAQTSLIANQPTIAGVVKASRTIRAYPPFFFLAVHPALKFTNDEAGLRLPAALFGALAVLAVFLLGRAVGNDLIGLAAACLFLFTPGCFRYFVDGNPYTLLMLASALSTLLLWRATERDRARDWWLYGIVALVGLGTHLLFAIHVAAQCVAGVYRMGCTGTVRGWGRYRRLLAVMVLLAIPASIFYVVYLTGGGDRRPIDFSRAMQPWMPLMPAGLYLGPLSLGSIGLLGWWLPLQAAGAAALFRKDRRALWTLSILMVVPLVAITLFIASTLTYVAYRYALGVFPLACVVAAMALEALPERSRVWRMTAGAAIVVYCLAGAAFILRSGPDGFGYQDWRSAAASLRRSMRPGDRVLVAPARGSFGLSYYLNVASLSTGSQAEAPDMAQRLLLSAPGRDAVVWVVLSTMSNENPVVARFTELRDPNPDDAVRSMTSALRSQGLAVCRTERFHRVTVVAVQRRPCEP